MLIPWLSRLPSFNFYSFYHTNIFVKSPCRLPTWWSTKWPYQKVVTDQIFKKNLNVSIYLQSGLNVGEQALTCTGSVRYCKASQVAQWAKNPLEIQEMQETWAWSLGWEDPLEEGMAAHASILAWRIPRTEEPEELQSTGLQKVRHDWSDWAHAHTNTHTHTHTHMLSAQQLFLIIPEVEPHFLFWGQCIQSHKMTHNLPNSLMILLFFAMFGLRSALWSISYNRNICAPERK